MPTQCFNRGSFVNPVGPGSYQLGVDRSTKKYYMGQKTTPPQPKHNASCYLISSESVSKLSNHRAPQAVRIKTEYYPKSHLHAYDNRVPGPGTCTSQSTQMGRGKRRADRTGGPFRGSEWAKR